MEVKTNLQDTDGTDIERQHRVQDKDVPPKSGFTINADGDGALATGTDEPD
ncbi:MAG: hypothetical protein AAF657_26970 [Acidobacteriota bacterium]